jgi:hypothetical protein
VVQAVVVAIPFAILGLALSEDFFEDWGWVVGPVVWLVCSLVTARILDIPRAYVLVGAPETGRSGYTAVRSNSTSGAIRPANVVNGSAAE